MGDRNWDGVDTPGLYRQSDGYAYLRNSNTQDFADISFFFGDPGDIPVAGNFNADGCDTLSIYRPSEARFYGINQLGINDGGLGAAEPVRVFRRATKAVHQLQMDLSGTSSHGSDICVYV